MSSLQSDASRTGGDANWTGAEIRHGKRQNLLRKFETNTILFTFAVPPTNVSVCRSFYREVLPLSTVTQDSPYLFRLFSDNLWTDLSRVYLHLELSIEKATPANQLSHEPNETDDTDVGPIQSIGQTFVQQLKVPDFIIPQFHNFSGGSWQYGTL